MRLVAISTLANFQLVHVCHAIDNSSFKISNAIGVSGFKIDLHYSDLIATITPGDKLPLWGNEWEEIAKGINADADAAPFSSIGSADRYDLWPRLTVSPGSRAVKPPTYLVRVSLIPGAACATRKVSQHFLKAFATMFTQIAAIEPRPDAEFTGTVDHGKENFYQFKLQYTGAKVASSSWWQDHVDQPVLDTLNMARETILKKTTKQDLIWCIGGSGSYVAEKRTVLQLLTLLKIYLLHSQSPW